MNLHDVWQVSFDFLPDKRISVEPVEENISTDAGYPLKCQHCI